MKLYVYVYFERSNVLPFFLCPVSMIDNISQYGCKFTLFTSRGSVYFDYLPQSERS